MKPPEILELEKELGFELFITNDSESILFESEKYMLNNQERVIGLNLRTCGFQRISLLGILKNLEYLNLKENQIIDVDSLSFLKNLKILDLSYNQINNIGFISALKKLQELNLERNQIQEMGSLSNLEDLRILNLKSNKIASIPTSLTFKKLRKLHLSNNKIKDIKELSKLTDLEELHLDINTINDISPLYSLKKLEELWLDDNQIQFVTRSLFKNLFNLREIYLTNNPIKNIPKEIYDMSEWGRPHKNVLVPVRTYLQDLERGASANNDVKLVLLGNGGVGKTQIAKRLAEQARFVFNAQHDSTHGIVLLQRTLDNLNLNIWDFAGQDIYHATHRLFMQTRALFVLVWDVANETSPYHEYQGRRYKNEKLQYWLEYARCFAPESPILVVQNKVDTPDESEQTYLEQTLEYYKTHYLIIEFVQVSAQTGYNFDVLEYWLAESFRQDENLKRQLLIDIPTSWAQVRARIRVKQAEQEKTLSVEDFKTLCADEGIPDSWHTLLQYLHDTSVLYYREGYFGNQIILDQAWAIDTVYAVLNRQSFYFRTGKIKKGRLQYTDLQALWQDNTDKERSLFIDFMLSTELCFETTENKNWNAPLSERTFVVPQLLPEDKPKAVEFEEQERNIRQVSEAVQYRFLPAVFIQRFIVAAHRFSKVELMWQHGILLQWQEHYAVVKADYDKKQILIHSTNSFLIQKIKEELDIITNEGRIRATKLSKGEDPIERGERFLTQFSGLKGLILLQDIRELVANDNLAEALRVLNSMIRADFKNEVAIIQNRLNHLESAYRNGVIDFGDTSPEQKEIAESILELWTKAITENKV